MVLSIHAARKKLYYKPLETLDKIMEIRKPYDPHQRVQVHFTEPSLTKQAMGAETDINNIMRKYEKDGIITHLAKHQGQYGDFSEVVDYHTALNTMIEADDAFASLPSRIRGEFNNDPGKFLDFVHDPKNIDKMVEMGLATAKPGSVRELPIQSGKLIPDDVIETPPTPPKQPPTAKKSGT